MHFSTVCKNENINSLSLREKDYQEFESKYKECDKKLFFETVSILQEIYEMYNYGIVGCKDDGEFDYFALFGCDNIVPSKLKLTQLGKHYYDV